MGIGAGAMIFVFRGDSATEEGVHKRLGKFALEKPAEGEGGDEILRFITAIHDLMRERGPEGTELAGLDADLTSADEIGDPAGLEEIHLDLVVAIGTLHGHGMPTDTGESVGCEVRAARIEGFHDVRIPELFAHFKEVMSRK